MSKPRPNNLCRCNSGRKYKKCCEPRHEMWRANPIVAGVQSPRREVPADIPRPDYIKGGVKFEREPGIIKGPDAIARMRKACRLAQEVLEITKRAADVGVTTDALDAIAHDATIERCAYPSPLGYQGYPKSICTSVNEVICHGIPDSRPLGSGDIVNIDVTVYHEGMHGDLSETLLIGEVDDLSRRLVEVTRKCLSTGIEQVGPGQPLRAVGQAIEACAHPEFSVVRAFVGHGLGERFHMEPQVPHYYDRNLRFILKPGMTFTLEPMINGGDWRHLVWDDGWTAVTADLLRSAQFEHTLLVTEDGVEVLTLPEGSPRSVAPMDLFR